MQIAAPVFQVFTRSDASDTYISGLYIFHNQPYANCSASYIDRHMKEDIRRQPSGAVHALFSFRVGSLHGYARRPVPLADAAKCFFNEFSAESS